MGKRWRKDIQLIFKKKQLVDEQTNLPHIGSNWNGGQQLTNGCPQKETGIHHQEMDVLGAAGWLLWEEFGIAPWWAHPALASSTMQETGMREHQGMRMRSCFMRSRYTPRGTCTLKNRKSARRKEQQRKAVTFWPRFPALLTAALKGLPPAAVTRCKSDAVLR